MFHEVIITVRALTLKAGMSKAVVSLVSVCECVRVMIQDDLDLESCVIRYRSCKSLQGGY